MFSAGIGSGWRRGLLATEPFDETWIDFIHAWPKVKFPKGNEPMIAILKRAKDSPPPAARSNNTKARD